MAALIILRYPATCAHCKTDLKPGQQARYFGPNRIYGINCHDRAEGSTADIISTPAKPLKRGEYERYLKGEL